MHQHNFGPRNQCEAEIFAVEEFVVNVQCAIRQLMMSKGVSQIDLAKLLDVSEEYVNEMFGGDCILTLRTLAKVFYVFGKECVISTKPRTYNEFSQEID